MQQPPLLSEQGWVCDARCHAMQGTFAEVWGGFLVVYLAVWIIERRRVGPAITFYAVALAMGLVAGFVVGWAAAIRGQT